MKTFIFDLDGTLVNLPINWEGLREKLRKLFNTNISFTPIFNTIQSLASKDEGARLKAFKVMDGEELKAVESVAVRREVVEMLNSVKGRGYKIVLVTLQGAPSVMRLLDKEGLQGLFDLIITREDSMIREEQLIKALKLIDSTPQEAIFIGDKYSDIQAGKAVKCKTACIRRPGADYMLDDVCQIQELLS